jgi:type IV secretory pathway TraG/TraD family ATPase VirD4
MKFKGIRLGHSRESGAVLRYRGPGHLITVAPTRSGKGRDVLIPALLEWPYSVLVVDPKAELASVTCKQRGRFGKVKFLDPYGEVARYVKGATSSQCNPMARLDPKSIEFAAQAGKISSGLNPDEGPHHRFFSGGARGLCSGIQMGLVRHGEAKDKNLVAMRSVLTGEFQGGVDVFGFAQSIMQNSRDAVLRQLVAPFAMPGAKESRSLGDIINTANVNTQFISDYAIAQSLSDAILVLRILRRKS